MKTFNVMTTDGPKPVFVDRLTDRMQMRISWIEDHGNLFECNIDFIDGKWIISDEVTGTSLEEIVCKHIEFERIPNYCFKKINPKKIRYILIIDDEFEVPNNPVDGKIAEHTVDIDSELINWFAR